MRRRRTFVIVASALIAAMATASCEERFPRPLVRGVVTPSGLDAGDAGDADADADAPLSASTDADAAPAPVVEGGVCNARVAAPPLAPAQHVPEGTPITYASNPPSSGSHYPVWANFQEFTEPVEDGYLVHSLEHGAVLLLYKCDDDAGACDSTLAQLRAVRDAAPTDPLCSASERVRIIIAPRAANDAPIAAAAWGHTYHADCVDPSTLGAFIQLHYAQAPENFCIPGSTF